MKEYKRSIDRSVREMDREVVKLQNQEKKLIIEIKKSAKESQQMVFYMSLHFLRGLSISNIKFFRGESSN
jgi:hypothetical protein